MYGLKPVPFKIGLRSVRGLKAIRFKTACDWG